jgi:hypothetical protein
VESVMSSEPSGSYYVWFEVSVDVTLRFEDGSSDSINDIYGSASWNFNWTPETSEIQSLSITFNAHRWWLGNK